MTNKLICNVCGDTYYLFEKNKHLINCKIKIIDDIILYNKKINSLTDINDDVENQLVDYIIFNIYNKKNNKCINHKIFNILFIDDNISLIINKLFWFIECIYNKKMFYLKNTMNNIEYYYYRDKIIKKKTLSNKDDEDKLNNIYKIVNIKKK